MAKLEKITFQPEGEDPVEFFVLEQTRIGGFNYILVTDLEEGDGEALIGPDQKIKSSVLLCQADKSIRFATCS